MSLKNTVIDESSCNLVCFEDEDVVNDLIGYLILLKIALK